MGLPALYALLLYAIVTGAVATAGGLLFAAYVTTPWTPLATWYAAAVVLTAMLGALTGPLVVRWRNIR